MHPITVTYDGTCQVWRAADDDREPKRAVLAYVKVESAGYLVATTGHIAAVVPAKIAGAPDGWEGALVPWEFLKRLGKGINNGGTVCFTIEGKEAVGLEKQGSFRKSLGAGTFPKVLRVLPEELPDDGPTVSVVSINAAYLERVALAVGHPRQSLVPQMWSSTDGAVLIPGARGTGAIGLVMPGSGCVSRSLLSEAALSVASMRAALAGERQEAAA